MAFTNAAHVAEGGSETHRITSVQGLHDDAYGMYYDVVMGGNGYSADAIIANLNDGITILKNSWIGKDGVIQTNNVIKVYNGMISIRNTLAEFSAYTSKIAQKYRNIQNSNGAGLESFGVIAYEDRAYMPELNVSSADTIDIAPQATSGRDKVNTARDEINNFNSKAKAVYDRIINNWTAGPRRQEFITRFDELLANCKKYQQTLGEVAKSVEVAIANYNQ